ncbi:MAG: DUF547 domain-containing protein [Gammaproteobacteria bacterium]|nr:DUF547 domain-containing protein [Gammaproteobacteria bacterium]
MTTVQRYTHFKSLKKIAIMALCLVLSHSAYGFSLFPDSHITEFWTQSAKDSETMVDHSAWDSLLKKYVEGRDGINLFAYGSMDPSDRDRLAGYLKALQSVLVSNLDSREQFAYWVNLYNALTIQVIVEHYPVESIKDISYGLLPGGGPWREKLVTVEGMKLSLDDIEHRILRPVFQDNRIHYAVNCASMGCPNLQDRAFTRANLESLLELGARQYINHPRGVFMEDDILILSSIFDWYRDDFGDNEAEIIQHLLKYTEPERKKVLEQYNSIDGFRYDWSLNE